MTTERDEYGFEEWAATDHNVYDLYEDEIARKAWHAALDAIRAELARKSLWIAPAEPDYDMVDAAELAETRHVVDDRLRGGHDPQLSFTAAYEAMRDSYLAYYGNNHEGISE
jgi:hypothetical protein